MLHFIDSTTEKNPTGAVYDLPAAGLAPAFSTFGTVWQNLETKTVLSQVSCPSKKRSRFSADSKQTLDPLFFASGQTRGLFMSNDTYLFLRTACV